VAVVAGDWEKANELYEQVLARARQVGNREREVSALNNLGVVAYERADWEITVAYAQQALPLAREMGQQQLIALLLNNLADVLLRLDDFAQARRYLHEGITLAQQMGAVPHVLTGVQTAGLLLARQGDQERGLALIGLSLNHPSATPETRRTAYDCLRTLALDPTDTAVQSALAQGNSLDLDTIAGQLLADWG
jgi:tetratricopeptide (TPR) repeat protein